MWIPSPQGSGGKHRCLAKKRAVKRGAAGFRAGVVQQWPGDRDVVSRTSPSISGRRCQGQQILEAFVCKSGYVLSLFASSAEGEMTATPLSHPSAAIWQPPLYINTAAGLHAIC